MVGEALSFPEGHPAGSVRADRDSEVMRVTAEVRGFGGKVEALLASLISTQEPVSNVYWIKE